MTLVQTQAGASTDEVNRMGQAILELAPKVGIGPDELATGLYHLESAGFRGAQAMDLLTAAAEGARVGQANLEDVTQAMIALTASQIRGFSGAGQAMGILNAIVGVGDMRMEQLAKAMSTGIMPSAAVFGLSVQDVGAALATLTDNAVPAELAATRLRMSISMMGAPSAAAAKQLATIGLSSTQLADDMRNKGIVAALQDLQQHLVASGKTASQQAEVLSRAFGGGQSSSAILTLLSQLPRVEEKFRNLTDATNTFGAAWASTQETAAQQAAEMKASFDTALIALGQALMPVLQSVMKFLLPIVQGITDWISQNKELAANILIAVGVLGALAVAVAVVSAAFGVLMGLVAVIGGALALIFSPVTLVVLAVIGVIALLVNALGGLGPVAKGIGDFINFGIIQPMQTLIGIISTVVGAIGSFIGKANDFIGSIPGPWHKTAESMRQDMQNVTDSAIKNADAYNSTSQAIQDDARETASHAAQNASVFAASQVLMGDSAAQVSAEVRSRYEMMKVGISNFAGDAHKTLAEMATTTASDLTNAIDAGAKAITDRRDLVQQAWQKMIDDLKHPMSQTKEIARDIGYLASTELAKGLHSGDPAARLQAAHTRDIIIAELQQLQPTAGTMSRAAMDAIKTAMKSKDPEIRAEAQLIWANVHNTGDAAAKQAYIDALNTGRAYADGLRGAYGYVKNAALYIVGAGKTIMHAASPPDSPESPLHEIDRWGFKTAMAWVEGVRQAQGHAQAAFVDVAGGPARQLQSAAPTSLSVASQAGGTQIHHIHLEVDGRELASIIDHHLGIQMPLAGTSVLRPMGG